MRKNLTGQARYSSTNKQISSETFTLNPLWLQDSLMQKVHLICLYLNLKLLL